MFGNSHNREEENDDVSGITPTIQNWDWEEQRALRATKCERCGFMCDSSEKIFCDACNSDGGAGK